MMAKNFGNKINIVLATVDDFESSMGLCELPCFDFDHFDLPLIHKLPKMIKAAFSIKNDFQENRPFSAC